MCAAVRAAVQARLSAPAPLTVPVATISVVEVGLDSDEDNTALPSAVGGFGALPGAEGGAVGADGVAQCLPTRWVWGRIHPYS